MSKKGVRPTQYWPRSSAGYWKPPSPEPGASVRSAQHVEIVVLSKLHIWGLLSASAVQKWGALPCPVKVLEMHFWVAKSQPCL